jgi:hypothetical protein
MTSRAADGRGGRSPVTLADANLVARSDLVKVMAGAQCP